MYYCFKVSPIDSQKPSIRTLIPHTLVREFSPYIAKKSNQANYLELFKAISVSALLCCFTESASITGILFKGCLNFGSKKVSVLIPGKIRTITAEK